VPRGVARLRLRHGRFRTNHGEHERQNLHRRVREDKVRHRLVEHHGAAHGCCEQHLKAQDAVHLRGRVGVGAASRVGCVCVCWLRRRAPRGRRHALAAQQHCKPGAARAGAARAGLNSRADAPAPLV
jgi:hypothetical protein